VLTATDQTPQKSLKTEVQSLQWSPGAKQLCLRGQKFFVLNSTNMWDEQIQQAARK